MCEFSPKEVVEYSDHDCKAVNEDDHLKKQPPHILRCQSYSPDVLLGKLYLRYAWSGSKIERSNECSQEYQVEKQGEAVCGEQDRTEERTIIESSVGMSLRGCVC